MMRLPTPSDRDRQIMPMPAREVVTMRNCFPPARMIVARQGFEPFIEPNTSRTSLWQHNFQEFPCASLMLKFKASSGDVSEVHPTGECASCRALLSQWMKAVEGNPRQPQNPQPLPPPGSKAISHGATPAAEAVDTPALPSQPQSEAGPSARIPNGASYPPAE